MEISNSHFTANIDLFAGNTYIMIIFSAHKVPTILTKINIKSAVSNFDRVMSDHI